MEQILSTFGIDWKLLLINALNFALALTVLWYFLYTPIMRVLEERREKVSRGVKDAESAQAKLKEIETSRGATLAAAGKEADDILAGARAAGTKKEREITAQAEGTAAAVLEEAQVEAQELKHRAIEESRQEVAKLVVLGLEKGMAPVSLGASRGGKQK